MNFDFDTLYKTYSNKQLLKILKQPEDYQPEAVASAERILHERDIAEEEIQLLEQELLDRPSNLHLAGNGYIVKDDEGDILAPILNQNVQVKMPDRVKVFLALITAQYVWMLYTTLMVIVSYLQCKYCGADLLLFFQVFTILYVPVIFFLVYKRHQWGWILLFADNLFIFFSRCLNLYMVYNFQHVDDASVSGLLTPVLIKLIFLLFLWQGVLVNYFGITNETKMKTVLTTALAALVFFVFVFWLK